MQNRTQNSGTRLTLKRITQIGFLAGGIIVAAFSLHSQSTVRPTLSGPFQRHVLAPVGPESPLELRQFVGAVKTDSRGRVITGPTDDPVKNIVGAESTGLRAGLERFTKITFAVDYSSGQPDPGQRMDPRAPAANGGSHHWPHVDQPFRSWPTSVALTPDGRKLYVSLPGREGYPDWRVAVIDTTSRSVQRWVDLRASGSLGTRPIGLAVSPVNSSIYPRPYVVVLNQYANYATVIDTGSDAAIGDFEAGFYAEKLVFNKLGTRLYTTDRFKDQVRVFDIAPGPAFRQIAEIPTGTNDLDRANPRDLALSDDETHLYVANTLGHTIAVIDTSTLTLDKTMIAGGLATDVKIAGPWGIVSGHSSTNALNQPETGNGMPKRVGPTASSEMTARYFPICRSCPTQLVPLPSTTWAVI